MPFHGAGVYEIVSYQEPKLNLNAWGGGTSPGQEVKLFGRDPVTENALWQLAVVSGPGEEAEYVILNVASGYYLTAPSGNTVVTVPQASPKDPKTRWRVSKAFTNGYDVWTIDSVAGKTQLNVKGSGKSVGTEILNWPIENGDNTKFYFDPRK